MVRFSFSLVSGLFMLLFATIVSCAEDIKIYPIALVKVDSTATTNYHGSKSSDIQVDEAKLGLGAVSGPVSGKFTMLYEQPQGNTIGVSDAYVAFNLKGYNIKTGRTSLVSKDYYASNMATDSYLTNLFEGWDTGVSVSKDYCKYFTLGVGAFNGVSDQVGKGNNVTDYIVSANTSYKNCYLGAVYLSDIAESRYINNLVVANTYTNQVPAIGVNLELSYSKFLLYVNYISTLREGFANGVVAGYPANEMSAYSYELNYELTSKVDLIGRYEGVHIVGTNVDHRYGLGANYTINKYAGIKADVLRSNGVNGLRDYDTATIETYLKF